MSSKMGSYNVEEFTKQKRQQGREFRVPPKANFLAAAIHIRSLFEGKKLIYGIMGGLEMLCLGYRREMPDLQIAYDDRDFHRIRAKLDSDPRVRLPEGMNSLFPSKILVRTGPAYKDEGCTQAADIEVDLIPPGSCGTPTSGNLTNNLVLLSLKSEAKLKSFKGLNMLHLVKTLAYYCTVRDLAWDPRKDILFLCQHYGEEVDSIRHQLDQKMIQQNLLGTPFFSRLSPEDQRRCYQVLLGTKPPPIMAITPPVPPPGHKHSVSASELIARPRISSHKSSPSLNVQPTPGLLSPPLPGKPNVPHKRAWSGDYQAAQLADPSHAPLSIPSDLPSEKKESRSRYRQISASHGQPTDANTATTSLTNSKLVPLQALTSTSKSPSENRQHPLSHQPHSSAHLNIGNMAKQNRKSMPNLHAGYSGPVPAYAFAQTPSMNGLVNQPQQMQAYVSPVEMSATPAPINPGQQYMKSQLGLGGARLPISHAVNNIPITQRPVPPQARSSQKGLQVLKSELYGSPKSEGQANQQYLIKSESNVRVNSQPPSAVELPSNYVQHVASETQLSERSDVDMTRVNPGPVELDAGQQLVQFIAELSVERCTPKPEQHHETTYRDSPVSPPDSGINHGPTPLQHEDMTVMPLNPRRQSGPLATLPASLMVGGPVHHKPDMTPPAASAPEPATIPKTNASRYTRYYASQTPPSSTPNSAQASPQPVPNSTYRAYQPPPPMTLSPPSLPLSPPEAQHLATETTERVSRPSFSKLRDVDGANGYFKTHPGHKRDASHDSQTSNASHDSSKLAEEYQAELPGYGAGYGPAAKS